MAEPLRIALVGCGGMGLRHLAAYAALHGGPTARELELVALVDPDERRAHEARRRFAEATGVTLPCQASVEQALAAGIGVAAVDLAIPTRHHHTLAIDACEAGLHVLVEKPLALTMRAAHAIVAAAERAGVTLAIAENFRRIPANRAIAHLIASGELGTPYWASSELVLPPALLHPLGAGDWYRDKLMSGSLVALEMGAHDADLIHYWFGPVRSVSATVRIFEPQVPGADGALLDVTSEDSCFATLETASGVVVQLALTMAGHGQPLARRLLVGSRGNVQGACWEAWQDGAITTDDGRSTTIKQYTRDYVGGLVEAQREALLPSGAYDPEQLTVDIADPLRYGIATEIVDFARAVARGRAPEIGGPEALHATAVSLALLESSLSGRPVLVDDVAGGRVDAWQRPLDAELSKDHPRLSRSDDAPAHA